MDIIRAILLAFAAVAVIVGAFTIFNSLSITVAQRTQEFGLLRMVGASRRQVRRNVLLEALAVGLLASAAGIAAGLGIEAGLNALFQAVGLELPATATVISARTIIVSLAVGMLTTVLAASLPARRATKIAPVAALRDGGRTTSASGASPGSCAASPRSSGARRSGSAAAPAGSPAATPCATPAARRSPPRR